MRSRPTHAFAPSPLVNGAGELLCAARHTGKLCGLPEGTHRKRRERTDAERLCYVGIDGEGQTDGGVLGAPHRYTLLAASDEKGGRTWEVADPAGLRSVTCLDFMTSLPTRHTRIGAYSFGYDLTKILEDLPNQLLYTLFRPTLRRIPGRAGIIRPVTWWTTAPDGSERCYLLNLLNTRFTVRRKIGEASDGSPRFTPPQTIHDIWRFFQGKFVGAIEAWSVGTPEARSHMQRMKDKRGEFDRESPEAVRAYCYEECRYMAELFRKLVDAHDAAGLELRSFFGAGSSAAAMMQAMGVGEHIKESRKLARQSIKVARVEERMREPVASAFFGGRFENSVIGSEEGPLHSYDISSAYPYQLCSLPCLLHGRWTRTTRRDRIEGRGVVTALVRYTLGSSRRTSRARAAGRGGSAGADSWGPFPFRLDTGAIVYPSSSGGGWVWRDEYLAGEDLFPHVHFREAWIYKCSCDCRPFAGIPRYYAERLRLGKEGPGIVLKLGCNSCYGKLAQSLGGAGQFTSWVWAGLITSGTRAQLLRAIGLHADRSNCLSVATDGLVSRERLALPAPLDTGTSGPDVVNERGEPADKPLGGWEEKIYERGMFFVRPGIFFPLSPSEADLKVIRGRGVGRGTVREHWRLISEAYEYARAKNAPSDMVVTVANLSRFIGAKTAITRARGEDGEPVYNRSEVYGRWTNRPVEMSFSPLPKREGVTSDGRLGLRAFPGVTSRAYARGILSAEAISLRAAEDEASEQPDGGDLTEGVVIE